MNTERGVDKGTIMIARIDKEKIVDMYCEKDSLRLDFVLKFGAARRFMSFRCRICAVEKPSIRFRTQSNQCQNDCGGT